MPGLGVILPIHLSGYRQGKELRNVHRLIGIDCVPVVGDRNPARLRTHVLNRMNHRIGGRIDHRNGIGARVRDVQFRPVGCQRQPVGLGAHRDVLAGFGNQSIGDTQRNYRDGSAHRIGDVSLRAVRQDRHPVRLHLYRHFRQAAIAVKTQIEEADAVVVGIDSCQERIVRGKGQRLGGSRAGESRDRPLGAYRLLPEPHHSTGGKAGERRQQLPVVPSQKASRSGNVPQPEQPQQNQA